MSTDQTPTPLTDSLIESEIARHPVPASGRADAAYYFDVHQKLAPLARALERRNAALVDGIDPLISKAARIVADWNHDNPLVRHPLTDLVMAATAALAANKEPL